MESIYLFICLLYKIIKKINVFFNSLITTAYKRSCYKYGEKISSKVIKDLKKKKILL